MLTETWTYFILGYYICQACGVVDRDKDRLIVGHKCPRCGTPSQQGLMFFDMTVGAIADLVAEFYPLLPPDSPPSTAPITDPPESHRLAILVFFCTLGEILLQHYLERCMLRLGLPVEIQERLLQDNLFPKQRIKRLFPILTGATWQVAVKAASKSANSEFENTVDFYLEATEKRNQLLHVGNKWLITPDMAVKCFDQMDSLIRLFVELHNIYLAKPI
jgi:hypothetical protein